MQKKACRHYCLDDRVRVFVLAFYFTFLELYVSNSTTADSICGTVATLTKGIAD